MQRKSPPVFIYLWKLVVDYMWFSFEYSVFICLFIQSDVNNSRWKQPPVFIYLCKWFVVKNGFRFNIYYLFFYLFKAMSTKAGGTDHLFLFTYGNLLFIYCGLRFNIHYLFIYLFKVMWTKTSGSDHLLLFTYANGLLIASGFRFNIYYIVVYLFKAMSTKAGGSDLYYRQQLSWGKVMFLHVSVNLSRISGSRQNTYGWQAGGTHPTGMLSCLLIQIGCCDLFLEINL